MTRYASMAERMQAELTSALLELTKKSRPKPLPGEKYNEFVKRLYKENGNKFKKHEVKMSDGTRPIPFEEACRRYTQRFTMEHIPTWADKPIKLMDGTQVYPAPHYATDKEWYENTEFLGEGTMAVRKYCRNLNQSYPCGRYLEIPFREYVKKLSRTPMRARSNKASAAAASKQKVVPKPKAARTSAKPKSKAQAGKRK